MSQIVKIDNFWLIYARNFKYMEFFPLKVVNFGTKIKIDFFQVFRQIEFFAQKWLWAQCGKHFNSLIINFFA